MRHHLLALCLLATVACASSPGLHEPVAVSSEQLLDGEPFGPLPGRARLISEDEVLAVSPEMDRFLATSVDRSANANLRLVQLVYALIGEGSFGLEYDEHTRTAAETFRLRRGNCLSFSNMFVAMARRVALEVWYQEVDIPPDWTLQGDTYVLNRHVNVVIDLGLIGEHVVDFNIDDFRASYDRRMISDQRALAHFYNNIGIEWLQKDRPAMAFHYFRKAIVDTDRRFAPAWTNLATLYRRKGKLAHAEAAYLQALQADRQHLVAMSNLAGLYEQLGRPELAARYRSRVASHRRNNPYYRYQLAREAFLQRDYDSAINHLSFAVRKRPGEDQFYFLLGLCHLQKGNARAARRWLDRAEEVAATDALKRNYSSKIDTLLGAAR